MAYLQRTWADVDLSCLDNNVSFIRQRLTKGCRIMGIVKADAYGHGVVAIAGRLEQNGVDWFGVSNLEEAIQLRKAGIDRPILVISYTPPTEAERLAAYSVTQAVVSSEYARELNAEAEKAGVTVAVHIKVDTGMSRVGFVCHTPSDVEGVCKEVVASCRLPHLKAEGIFTHFASADEMDDGGFTEHQFAMFTAVISEAEKQGVHFSLRHCCNSAASMRFPQMHLDMVREGIILYGLLPDGWMKEMLKGLKPLMSLKTTVSMLKSLPDNTPLSYGRTVATQGETRVATVPIGYADGYSRGFSNKGEMLIKGKRVPVLGRVCMDQCMLDVTAVPGVKEGDVVTVFGSDNEAVISVDELAQWMDTINYEIVCLIARRVPRVYWSEGKAVAIRNELLTDETEETV